MKIEEKKAVPPVFEGVNSNISAVVETNSVEFKSMLEAIETEETSGTEIKPEKTNKKKNFSQIINFNVLQNEKNNLKLKHSELNAAKINSFGNKRVFKAEELTEEDKDIIRHTFEFNNISLTTLNPVELKAECVISSENSTPVYKTFNISRGLSNLLEYSYKTQKPVRVDFQGNSSVILRLNLSGKITAEFLASNKAMSDILKGSIPDLVKKFETEGIPYEKISYREENSNNQNKKNKGGNQ